MLKNDIIEKFIKHFGTSYEMTESIVDKYIRSCSFDEIICLLSYL